jgi:hypothetical protein
MTLVGFENVKKVVELQWRLQITLIFRPTTADLILI